MKKINSLEGLRAIACICVFLHHFRLAFLPGKAIWLVDNTPFRILTAGGMAVRVLFVVSGFVTSYKYFAGKGYENVPGDIVKRYFRLAPPVLAAECLVYLLMRFGLLYHLQAGAVMGTEAFWEGYNHFMPSLFESLKEALVTCYLEGTNAYIAPLWTMKYEYLGVILVLCAISVCRDSSLLRYIFYLAVFAFFNSYYNDFVLGMFLCDIYTARKSRGRQQTCTWIYNAMFAAGCFVICMYDVDNTVKLSRMIFAAGMVMMFWGLLNSAWGEKILGNKVMRAGGKMSYAIYIVHWPIIQSFSCAYYLWMTRAGVNEYGVIFSCCVLTFVVVLAVAYVFCKYVEPLGQFAASAVKRYLENSRAFAKLE